MNVEPESPHSQPPDNSPRRNFIKKAAFAAAAGGVLSGCSKPSAVGAAATVKTSPHIKWLLASSFPEGLDTIYGASEVLAKRVKEITDGKFNIKVYAAGELVPGLEVMDAVQQGTAHVGHTASYYFIGKNPALAFDTSIPFGLTARQQFAWLYRGGGVELIREVYADFNIVNFPGGSTGAQMGGWFRKPINSLRDLKGLKMRIPGLGGKVMKRMGVSTQVIAGGEIYPALERGAIDATEWVGPYDDAKLGFHKIAKNYYYPGWWEPGPSLSFLVNRKAWDKLPADYQAAFEAAAAEACVNMLARYDAQNPPALQEVLAAGVTLYPFPREVLEEAQKQFNDLAGEIAASNAGYAKIYEQWKKFRDGSVKWFSIAEQSFMQFVSKV